MYHNNITDKNNYGCTLCNNNFKTTECHVPARTLGNTKQSYIYNLKDNTSSISPDGSSVYTLCRDCNNYFGILAPGAKRTIDTFRLEAYEEVDVPTVKNKAECNLNLPKSNIRVKKSHIDIENTLEFIRYLISDVFTVKQSTTLLKENFRNLYNNVSMPDYLPNHTLYLATSDISGTYVHTNIELNYKGIDIPVVVYCFKPIVFIMVHNDYKYYFDDTFTEIPQVLGPVSLKMNHFNETTLRSVFGSIDYRNAHGNIVCLSSEFKKFPITVSCMEENNPSVIVKQFKRLIKKNIRTYGRAYKNVCVEHNQSTRSSFFKRYCKKLWRQAVHLMSSR